MQLPGELTQQGFKFEGSLGNSVRSYIQKASKQTSKTAGKGLRVQLSRECFPGMHKDLSSIPALPQTPPTELGKSFPAFHFLGSVVLLVPNAQN